MSSKTTGYVKVTYTEFDQMVKNNLISEARIRSGTFLGKFKTPQEIVRDGEKQTYKGIEVQIGTYDQDFLKEYFS